MTVELCFAAMSPLLELAWQPEQTTLLGQEERNEPDIAGWLPHSRKRVCSQKLYWCVEMLLDGRLNLAHYASGVNEVTRYLCNNHRKRLEVSWILSSYDATSSPFYGCCAHALLCDWPLRPHAQDSPNREGASLGSDTTLVKVTSKISETLRAMISSSAAGSPVLPMRSKTDPTTSSISSRLM